MSITIPPLTMVVSRLSKLDEAGLRRLAAESGVPYSTIRKIRYGVTKDPGLETCRKFFALIPGESRANNETV